jgi:5'-nucleotidase
LTKNPKQMQTILLTNDDGFYSKGISALQTELGKKYHVWIVAPDREKSAISMALTLNHLHSESAFP